MNYYVYKIYRRHTSIKNNKIRYEKFFKTINCINFFLKYKIFKIFTFNTLIFFKLIIYL